MKREINILDFLVENKIFIKPEISKFNLNLHRDCNVTDQHNIVKALSLFADKILTLAVENAALCKNGGKITYLEHSLSGDDWTISKDSILQIKDWIK